MNPAKQHQSALEAAALEDRLEAIVFMVLSIRRSVAAPAQALARFDRSAQERFIAALELIASTSVELAYNFCQFAPPALGLMDREEWTDWVLHVMDCYDQGGVLAAIVAMQKVEQHLATQRASRTGVALAAVRGVLERFVIALSGRNLKLEAGAQTYTDTETLFLPSQIGQFAERQDNARLLKATAAHLWAQTWYGTWRFSLTRGASRFSDPERAIRLFHALETLRLDACIARDLSGLSRDMASLSAQAEQDALPADWAQARQRLTAPGACVQDSYDWLARLYPAPYEPIPACYQGVLLPDRVEAVQARRIAADKAALQAALVHLAWDLNLAGRRERNQPEPHEEGFTVAQIPDPEGPDGLRPQLRLHGEPLPPSPEVQQLMESIVQDLGAVPDDYLAAAGDGVYRAEAGSVATEARQDMRSEAGFVYDEWDYSRRQYRKDWCILRERDVHPQPDDFVERTLVKHRGLLKHLYRTFEALRGEDKRLKTQPYGDDIDIDAVVASFADQQAGFEASDRVFTKHHEVDRNIAVMVMVDMSGSTDGWINDVVREAVVLLCESLETLGDRYAVYGFSGFTHKRCEVYRIKRFEEPYDAPVKARISGIRPQDYTRMGVTIRHLGKRLHEVEARTKLLITLSDGRPDDKDGYRGEYGIEDTRQALLEVRAQGIHPYCITIDDEAMDYLPHMYGPRSFTVVDRIDKLPYKVSDIYRRITM